MKKVKNWQNVIHSNGIEFNDVSETIPDQAMTVKEIVARQGIGITNQVRNSIYLDDIQADKLLKMDKAERVIAMRNIKAAITTINKNLKDQRENEIKDAVEANIPKDSTENIEVGNEGNT